MSGNRPFPCVGDDWLLGVYPYEVERRSVVFICAAHHLPIRHGLKDISHPQTGNIWERRGYGNFAGMEWIAIERRYSRGFNAVAKEE